VRARTDTPPRVWTDDRLERLETLYCVMGLDREEIARALSLSVGAVKMQIYMLGLRLTPQAVQARRARGLNSRRWTTPVNRDYSNYGTRRPGGIAGRVA
jgi:hypothetical protein